ncbi:MAG: inositol monophosphatase family protein [Alphaproteobacteria bacterium]
MTDVREQDAEEVIVLLKQAADRFVLPRFDCLGDHEVREKKPGDLVTDADVESEHFLTAKLERLLPGSLVVGEEAHANNPEILARFDGDEPVWLIDPVDGTRNFTQGKSEFCMMVALVRRNRAVRAWIHEPLADRTVTAAQGAGAWCQGTRLSIPEPPAEADQTGQINIWYFEDPRKTQLRNASRKRFREVSSLSCAGADFLAQARGERHFSFYRRLWPWDHAPGVLIVREAGGKADRIDGTPYRAGDRVHGLLSAPSAERWGDLRRFLLGKPGQG